MSPKNNKVIIIGAGIAGLATALKLSSEGLNVEVYEKNCGPGGKLRSMDSILGPIDAGPTVFTLKPWFDDFFKEIGECLEDHLTISEQSVLARHWWPDNSTLDLVPDFESNLSSIRDFSGQKSAEEFEKFYKQTKIAFDLFESPIMRSPKIDLSTLLRVVLRNQRNVSSILFRYRNLWGYLSANFSDPRLRQLFARYATYVGASPFEAPPILALIWQAEARGVWQILGGMNKLPIAMEKLARKNGVKFNYLSEVKTIEIENGVAKGIIDNLDNFNRTDHIVFNGDPAAIYKGLLGKGVANAIHRKGVNDRSLSAFVWSFSSKPRGKNLSLHNVFFNSDYTSEFKDIGKGQMPNDPTIYICAQDRGISPNIGGKERFEIIVNGPPNLKEFNKSTKKEEFEKCKKITFETLKKMGQEFLQAPKISDLTTPTEFQKMFPGSDGSIYGLSPSKTLSTFRRPKVKLKTKGLYLAGGGVQPGPGVPMALTSGKHAAEMILKDLFLT